MSPPPRPCDDKDRAAAVPILCGHTEVSAVAACLPPVAHLSPKSDLSPRITPLDRLYGTLRFLRAGRAIPSCERTWRAFPLTLQEYKELQHRLQCDETLHGWYENKVRYD